MCVFGAMNEGQRSVAHAAAKLVECAQPSNASRDAVLMMEDMIGLKQAAAVIASMEGEA